MRWLNLSVLLALAVSLAALVGCGGGTESKEVTYVDVPAAVAESVYNLSGTVSADPADSGRAIINLAGIVDPTVIPPVPVTGLAETDFVVVENGRAKRPLSVAQAGSGGEAAPVDVVFVIDTTRSMSEEIGSVRDSISAFAASLASEGIDARFAAVTFGDSVATATRQFYARDQVAQFQEWLGASLSAQGGGDDPENPLDALEFAANNLPITPATSEASAGIVTVGPHENLAYRTGAQRILILITDATAHEKGDGSGWKDAGGQLQDFAHVTHDELVAHLQGSYVVHVISPSNPQGASGSPGAAPKGTDNLGNPSQPGPAQSDGDRYDLRNLAAPLGGVWVELPVGGRLDLSALPIASIISGGYLITYGDADTSTTHTLRLWTDGVSGPGAGKESEVTLTFAP